MLTNCLILSFCCYSLAPRAREVVCCRHAIVLHTARIHGHDEGFQEDFQWELEVVQLSVLTKYVALYEAKVLFQLRSDMIKQTSVRWTW